MSSVKFHGLHFAFVLVFGFLICIHLEKPFPEWLAVQQRLWMTGRPGSPRKIKQLSHSQKTFLVLLWSPLVALQRAHNSSSIPKAMSKPALLPRVLIPVVVPFGRISVLQFLHLGGSVEGSSFVCFLQETVVDVWENGKCRPFRIAKPYLDPVIPKNSKDQHCNKL